MPVPGSWPSPLTAAAVTAAARGFRQVAYAPDGTPWWAETRPGEGGRTVLVTSAGDQVPPGFDARSSFHEYGGLCWLPLPDGSVVTSSFTDQRLWRLGHGAPQPLTADTAGADRYCLPQPVEGGLLCLRERLDPVRNELVIVPLDGTEPQVLWGASDFVDAARVSPSGKQIAFVTWDHPRMPWDGTELRVARLTPTGLSDVEVVLGGPTESVFQPEWDGAGLRAVTDATGWWNLVRLPGGQPMWPVDEECGFPAWTPGYASHAALPDGAVAVLHGRGSRRLSVLDASGQVRTLGLPLSAWAPTLASHGTSVLGIAATATTPWSVVEVETATESWRQLAGASAPDPAWTPEPEELAVPSGNHTTYANVYPPTSPLHRADGPVPYVLMAHGGPTAQSFALFDPVKAFWTSRGFGVADVDYGGSSGYGRAYRDLLRGQWGVVDVEDCEAVARALLGSGRASAVVIRGGSAGGWTVLSALTRGGSVFRAGTSYYGVADLTSMAAHTHDFESRYLEGLVPAQDYAERSPLARVGRLDRPLLLLQGLSDKVVPPEQAERMLAALAHRCVPHAYLAFEGEGHGFRRAETQVAALEAELSFYGQVLGFDPPGVPALPLR